MELRLKDDEVVDVLEIERKELADHIRRIDDLLTHYDTPKTRTRDHLANAPGWIEQKKTTKRKTTKKKKAKRHGGGPATKKTDQEIAAMGQMFTTGVPMGDICKKLSVSDGTVYKYARLNNWKRGKEDTR